MRGLQSCSWARPTAPVYHLLFSNAEAFRSTPSLCSVVQVLARVLVSALS